MPSQSPTLQLLVEVPGAEVRTLLQSRTYLELSLRCHVKTQIKAATQLGRMFSSFIF